MAVALRSIRFIDEHGTLEVRECVDRTQVQILAESGPPMATDQRLMTLTAAEWSRLTSLPYLDRSASTRNEQVVEPFVLEDEHTSLEIYERAGHDSVLVVMNDTEHPDEDAALIELTAEQWQYLRALDYVSADPPARAKAPAMSLRPSPSGWVH